MSPFTSIADRCAREAENLSTDRTVLAALGRTLAALHDGSPGFPSAAMGDSDLALARDMLRELAQHMDLTRRHLERVAGTLRKK